MNEVAGYFYKHGDEWLQDKYGDFDSIQLYLHPAPTVPKGWQPIGTAPKSPDWVIGLFADGDMRRCVGDSRHWFDWNGFAIDAPTHWMPLPAAPKPGETE